MQKTAKAAVQNSAEAPTIPGAETVEEHSGLCETVL